jgi:hypothetical protein
LKVGQFLVVGKSYRWVRICKKMIYRWESQKLQKTHDVA